MLESIETTASVVKSLKPKSRTFTPEEALPYLGFLIASPIKEKDLRIFLDLDETTPLESVLEASETIVEVVQDLPSVSKPYNNDLEVIVPMVAPRQPSRKTTVKTSRYLADRNSGFLSANNQEINKKVVIRERGTDKNISDLEPIVAMLKEAGYDHRNLKAMNQTLNLFLSSTVLNTRKDMYTRVSLTESRYTGSGMSYTAIKKLIDALEKADQLEVIYGFNAAPGFEKGRTTCVRFYDESPIYTHICQMVAKDELRFNLDNKYVVLVRDNKKVVHLVEGDKVPADTKTMFDLYKTAAATCTVSIPTSVTEDPNVTFLPKMDYKGGTQGYNLEQLTPIHQVFNKMDLSKGGRYYCGISNLKKETRKRILINGRLTSEIDIRSCHLMFLANEENQVFVGDSYENPLTSREVNKLFINIALNCKSQYQMKTALSRRIEDLNCPFTVDEYLAFLDSKFPWLTKYLGKGVGLSLQRTEAKIMCAAMTSYMKQTKSLVISIHDGCIVAKKYETTMVDCLLASIKAAFPLTKSTVLFDNTAIMIGGTMYKFDEDSI